MIFFIFFDNEDQAVDTRRLRIQKQDDFVLQGYLGREGLSQWLRGTLGHGDLCAGAILGALEQHDWDMDQLATVKASVLDFLLVTSNNEPGRPVFDSGVASPRIRRRCDVQDQFIVHGSSFRP